METFSLKFVVLCYVQDETLLKGRIQLIEVPANSVLGLEGDLESCVYFIATGKLKVFRHTGDDPKDETKVGLLRCGLADRAAWLAQSVEHETLNLRVVGSSPTLGDHFVFSFSKFRTSVSGQFCSFRAHNSSLEGAIKLKFAPFCSS